MFDGPKTRRTACAARLAGALVAMLATAALAGIGPDLGPEWGPDQVPARGPDAVLNAGPSEAGSGSGTAVSVPPPVSSVRESRPIGPARTSDAGAEAPAPPAAGGSFLRTMLALAGVIALIGICGVATRAVARGRGGLAGAFGPGGRAPSGVISVLGRYPVSRGQKLVLLHLDRRILLVSQSSGGRLGAGGGMATLCEISDPEEVASILVKSRDAESDSISERFRSMLGAVDRAFRPGQEAVPEEFPRRRLSGSGGDRAELWNDSALSASPEAFPIKQPGPPEHDAVGSLRRRLASLRSDPDAEALA
jgi:hypothetical protein